MLIFSSMPVASAASADVTSLSPRFSSFASLSQSPESAAGPSTTDSEPRVSATTRTAAADYRQQREFEFELTTRDGDRVKVRAFSGEAGSLSVMHQQVAGQGVELSQVALSAHQESRAAMRFEVKGDLDADELAAINDLLSAVGSVSEQFFAGDPLQAFEQLQAIGFDSAEIAGFSLELEQRTAVAVSYREAALAQYRDIAGQPDQRSGLGLGRYVADLERALSHAEALDDPRRQLQALVALLIEHRATDQAAVDGDSVTVDALAERVERMNQQLLDWLEGGSASGAEA